MRADNSVKTGIDLIASAAYDSVIADLIKLDLDKESYRLVLSLIEHKKEECMLDSKKRNKARLSKEGGVSKERQCKHESNGHKCRSFVSNHDLGLCWMHMSEKQQKEYRANKKQ
jgi:hypothetical protein